MVPGQLEQPQTPNHSSGFHFKGRSFKARQALNSMAEAPLRKAAIKCKVGNPNCPLEKGKSLATGAVGVVSCDICCSESDFCRDCMCILCGNTINGDDHTPYTSIRCLARLSGAGFCGHAAHLMCALECQMAGVVKQLGLDMEYICRRCDQTTDLRENIVHLLGALRYTNSSTSVQRILGMALHTMQGTEHGGAKSLESLIKTAIQMVAEGANICDVFDMLHGTGAKALTAKFDVAGEPSEFKDGETYNTAVKKVKGNFTDMGTPMYSGDKMQVDITEQEAYEASEYTNDGPRVEEDRQKNAVELDTSQPLMMDTSEEASKVSLIFADPSIQRLNAGFENDIQEALNKLRDSQAAEYDLANDRLNAQKEYIMNLYKQLGVANPLPKLPLESANASTDQISCTFQESQKEWTNFQTKLLLESANASMDPVSYTFQELQKESSNLETMLGIGNGFGQTSQVILDRFFGLPMEQE